jgi:outer membrane protein OmpA-like peptidoglycan-associated protein
MMKRFTKPLVLVTALGLGVVAAMPPASAANASRQESIGFGTGAAVGAAAGGPVGFLVGAAVGAKLGDLYHQKDVRNEALNDELVAARQDLDRLEAELAATDGDLRRVGTELRTLIASGAPEMLELMKTGIEMDLLFGTEEDELSAESAARVDELARVLATLPSVQIRLDAWADPRGEEDYNQSLSERRAEHVQGLLTAGGIPASRVSASAHGEAAGEESDPDRNALQRRVSVTLYVPEEGAQRVAETR